MHYLLCVCILCLLCAASCGSLAFVCILASLFTCSCMCLCMFSCATKHSSYLLFHAGLHPSLYTKSRVLFRNFAWWHICCMYFNLMDLWKPHPNPHLSFEDTLYLLACSCFFTCFFPLFACLHVFFPLLACLVY